MCRSLEELGVAGTLGSEIYRALLLIGLPSSTSSRRGRFYVGNMKLILEILKTSVPISLLDF